MWQLQKSSIGYATHDPESWDWVVQTTDRDDSLLFSKVSVTFKVMLYTQSWILGLGGADYRSGWFPSLFKGVCDLQSYAIHTILDPGIGWCRLQIGMIPFSFQRCLWPLNFWYTTGESLRQCLKHTRHCHSPDFLLTGSLPYTRDK